MSDICIKQRVSKVRVAADELPETLTVKVLEGLSGLKFEACSNPGVPLVATSYHPFVSAATAAFAHHRPLVLSPDMFWLLVTQGVAQHVQANAQTLRDRFVTHDGKETINVRRDDFVKRDPSNPWSEVLGEFSTQIKSIIGEENHVNLVATFSTTTEVERAANEIVLMNTLENYFDYEVSTLCGIPSVSLEGTVDDWSQLRPRVAAIGEAYDLSWWTDRLAPILERIAANAAGADDAGLWRGFYKLDDMSGGPYIGGWIADFFPYLETPVYFDEQGAEMTFKEFYERGCPDPSAIVNQFRVSDWFSAENKRGITTDKLPGSLSHVPFKWQYLEQECDMNFVAGFVGILQNKRDKSVRPAIGWGVGEAGETRDK